MGSAENMRRVAQVIQAEGAKITVLSAMSGVTDTLIRIARAAQAGETGEAAALIAGLREKYSVCIDGLLKGGANAGRERMEQTMTVIEAQAADFREYTSERIIIAQGELLTTAIFTMFLNESGVKAVLLNAPDFIVTDAKGQVDAALLRERLSGLAADPSTYYITQGFICTNACGQTDNLGRGGSDFSAALIGVAVGARQVQIWTDIDGMHNNDPRVVSNTRPIRRMSFDEAAELAYFGAKILHPATIQPCKDSGIPVFLKNTMDPAAPGTEISNGESCTGGFRAVAAKDGITEIRICSTRMLMAYGFLRRVFEVFEECKTPIDMITTSEVAVSLTIDNDAHLSEIEAKLQEFGTINIEKNNTIVCVVGQCGQGQTGMAARIFDTLTGVPVKMISYGASERSVAMLIDTKYKKETLQSLNDGLFS